MNDNDSVDFLHVVELNDVSQGQDSAPNVFISYTDDKGTNTSKTYSFNADTTWPEHLQKFLELLEGVGYVGVRDQVAIKVPHDYYEYTDMKWHGNVYAD
jgi:hypothetical protein